MSSLIGESPLISCLCVTRNKAELLARAIKCFKAQTYPKKELIIIYENDDRCTKHLVQSIRNDEIRVVEVSSNPKTTLGELRNIAVQESRGDYVCQWDDDDWYHDRRMEVQMKSIAESFKRASVLLSWIVFDATANEAYISPMRIWEGSILFEKNIFSDELKYENISKGEDTGLVQKMLVKNYVYPLLAPCLYIYVFHGKNTFDEGHFKKIFNHSQRLPRLSSQLIKDILDAKYENSTASKILSGKQILGDIDYFFSMKRMNIGQSE